MTASTVVRKPGSKVSVDHPNYPGVWIVRSNGPVNAVVEPENGGRRGLRVPHTMLTDPGAPPTVRPSVFYHPGELVRIMDGKHAGLWVVIADKGGERVNIARIGGDDGRYLRYPRHQGLVKVDPAFVLKAV